LLFRGVLTDAMGWHCVIGATNEGFGVSREGTMKIVVTGATGNLGKAVCQQLTAHGHDVLGIDQKSDPSVRGVWIGNLCWTGDLFEACRGAGAIVHLAAIQAPNLAPDSVTFNNNISATYNVFKVAADLGIRNVVTASSNAAYGFVYARTASLPDYLPLDEDHPCRPTDPYGLSKLVGETIATSFALQTGASAVTLRLPGINFDPTYSIIATRMKNPHGRLSGFWSYIDVRDAVEACRLALAHSRPGHHVFNVAAPTSSMRQPTDELLRQFLPTVPKKLPELTGNWSGIDSRKAGRELGFRAEHVWERYLTLHDADQHGCSPPHPKIGDAQQQANPEHAGC
jgi:UDP-glucose 4-epimerase